MNLIQNLGEFVILLSMLVVLFSGVARVIYTIFLFRHRQPWAPWLNILNIPLTKTGEAYFTEQALPHIQRARRWTFGFLSGMLLFVLGVLIVGLGS